MPADPVARSASVIRVGSTVGWTGSGCQWVKPSSGRISEIHPATGNSGSGPTIPPRPSPAPAARRAAELPSRRVTSSASRSSRNSARGIVRPRASARRSGRVSSTGPSLSRRRMARSSGEIGVGVGAHDVALWSPSRSPGASAASSRTNPNAGCAPRRSTRRSTAPTSAACRVSSPGRCSASGAADACAGGTPRRGGPARSPA